MKYSLFLLLVFVCGSVLNAQQNIDAGCRPKPKIQPDGSLKVTDCKGAIVISTVSEDQGPENRSDAVNLPVTAPASIAYQEYLEAYYKYRTHSLRNAASTFDWQYKASIAIFILVITLVLSGLTFAGIQFRIAMKVPTKAATSPKTPDAPEESALASTLDFSTHGVKITSSVIGLLILVVSLGFFYLYLMYVYPIQNIAK